MTGSGRHLEEGSYSGQWASDQTGDEPRSEDGDSGRRERLLGDEVRGWEADLLYRGLLSPGGVVEEDGEGVESGSTGRRLRTDMGREEGAGETYIPARSRLHLRISAVR
jgi:hypothetical protein